MFKANQTHNLNRFVCVCCGGGVWVGGEGEENIMIQKEDSIRFSINVAKHVMEVNSNHLLFSNGYNLC